MTHEQALYAINYDSYYLAHHGIKGQKWGDRKYQNSDGSLTPAGRQRYGVGVRMGIRMRGLGQRIRSVANNTKNAKGLGAKVSNLVGYEHMRTVQENRARVQDKLADASRTKLGKALHTQRKANAKYTAKYADAMRHKSLGVKIVENTLLPLNKLKQPYARLSGRTTTVGKRAVDYALTGGLIDIAADVNYLSDKARSDANKIRKQYNKEFR